MRQIRDLWTELIERRLWPIPLVLIAALVAVPLLLAKPAPESDGAAAGGGPAAVASSADLRTPDGPTVSVTEEGDASKAPLRGREKDPFKQLHVPHKPKQAAAAADAVTSPDSGTTPSTDGGTGGDNGGAGSEPQQPQKTYVRAGIDVRFGPAGGTLRRIQDVRRLRPLPSAAHPVVIFLGMRSDHATAVFLVSTDVNAQGEGKCVPSRAVCQAIELREGQVALLDVRAGNGTVAQYELDLDKVTLHETTSKAEAQSSYARVSRAGARLLRRSVRSSRLNTSAGGRRLHIPFRYAAKRGVLHIKPYLSKRRAHGASGTLRDERAVDDPRG
jgi:hypothetical protein